MSKWKPKQDDESWEQFARRQIAYINMLEMELERYHNLIASLSVVNTDIKMVLRYHEMYGKDVMEKVKE